MKLNPHFNPAAAQLLSELEKDSIRVSIDFFMTFGDSAHEHIKLLHDISKKYHDVFFTQFSSDQDFKEWIQNTALNPETLSGMHALEYRALMSGQPSPAIAFEIHANPGKSPNIIRQEHEETYLKPYRDFLSTLKPVTLN